MIMIMIMIIIIIIIIITIIIIIMKFVTPIVTPSFATKKNVLSLTILSRTEHGEVKGTKPSLWAVCGNYRHKHIQRHIHLGKTVLRPQ